MNYTYIIKDSYLVEMDEDQINFLWTFKDLESNDFNMNYIEKNKWMNEIFSSLFDEELTHEEAYASFVRSREYFIMEQQNNFEK
jgi:hypothetical protein